MNIEKIDIKLLKLNDKNPRIIKNEKFKKLVKSIKEFPEMLKVRPIVVDEDMIVLGGNMRLKACKEAGLTEVYYIKFSNLSEEKKNEFIVKDNIGYGEWDFDIILSDWNKENLIEWGLEVPSFDEDDGNDEEEADHKITSLYQITISFDDEKQLEENYEKLKALGYNCKILQI